MHRLFTVTLILMAVLGLPGGLTAQEQDDPHAEDHAQLRGLLISLRDAFNQGQLDALEAHLYDPFAATMVDQEMLTSREDFDAYFEKWFGGDDPFVRRLTIDPVADTPTRIFDDRFGIVWGHNTETYELADGNSYLVNSRWTATVIKENGEWKLLTLHNGVNFLDNPVVEVARRATIWFGGGGILVGLVLGVVVGWRVLPARR